MQLEGFMTKRKHVVFILVIILFAAGAFTYYSFMNAGMKTADIQAGQSSTLSVNINTTASTESLDQSQPATDVKTTVDTSSTDGTASKDQLLNMEDIEVKNNTPEYELKAALCEDENKKTFIEIGYYKDGQTVSEKIDEVSIPGLAGIFENRSSKNAAIGAFKVKYAYLNSKNNKLYLEIQGNVLKDFAETAMYSFNLGDLSVKELFSFQGKFSNVAFNKDYSKMAYSFENPPYSSMYQESSVFEIIDCTNDTFVIKGSRDKNGKLVGDRDPAYIYNYTFISWQSNSIVKLNQSYIPKKKAAGINQKTTIVVFNLDKNIFMNGDGTPLITDNVLKNDAVKTLKNFYSLLGSEKDYPKAMELLTADFKLQMGILQQFGVSEITKADIDAKNASVYSEILRQAKLDFIVKDDSVKNASTIYYYHTIALNADSKIRQALIARIEKVDGKWEIKSIKDADDSKPPFN